MPRLPVISGDECIRALQKLGYIWSSPFKDAVDFGVAAEQWTVLPVLAPQVGQRLLVFNPATGGQGWIDVQGVGPATSP